MLNELRGYQTRDALAVSPAPVQASSESPHSPPTPYNSEMSFVQACVGAYMHRIRLIIPVLTLEALEAEMQLAETSTMSRQFILAFCAYVANFGNALEDSSLEQHIYSGVDIGRQSLKDALQVQNLERITDLSPRSMLISFFLYGAYAGLGDYQQGWFYKQCLRLRKEHRDVFVYGKFEMLDPLGEETFVYRKRYEGRIAVVVLNFTTEVQKLSVREVEGMRLLLSSYGKVASPALQPLEGRVYVDY